RIHRCPSRARSYSRCLSCCCPSRAPRRCPPCLRCPKRAQTRGRKRTRKKMPLGTQWTKIASRPLMSRAPIFLGEKNSVRPSHLVGARAGDGIDDILARAPGDGSPDEEVVGRLFFPEARAVQLELDLGLVRVDADLGRALRHVGEA